MTELMALVLYRMCSYVCPFLVSHDKERKRMFRNLIAILRPTPILNVNILSELKTLVTHCNTASCFTKQMAFFFNHVVLNCCFNVYSNSKGCLTLKVKLPEILINSC